MLSVLATGLKGRGFKPCRRDGFSRTIEISSTPCFGVEAKPDAPCHKILRHVNSSGSIVSDYGLDERAIEVRSPAGTKDFFL
jgi:hypothetical protein